ncbi:MAG: DUF302 domain-containing protein [Thermoplasmataceae archaeon]|jgi:uncharacterized protein (DUF302 family)
MEEEKVPEGLFLFEINLPFEVVTEKIKTALISQGFTIFAVIDHKQAALGVGLNMMPASVIIFGNPAGGTNMMKASRSVAIDLPSRILVSGNGKTRIYFNRMEYVKKRHSLRGMDEMASAFDSKIIGLLESIRSEAT